MKLTEDQKKFWKNLWFLGRMMFPGNLRAQALYVMSGLQKHNPDTYYRMLRARKIFPEFVGRQIGKPERDQLARENQANWANAFS